VKLPILGDLAGLQCRVALECVEVWIMESKRRVGLFLFFILLLPIAGYPQGTLWPAPLASPFPQTSTFRLPNLGEVSFHVGWAFAGHISVPLDAWAERIRLSRYVDPGFFTSFRLEDDRSFGQARLRFEATGLWLGASLPYRFGNGLSLRARAEYFFPFRDRIFASGSGNSIQSTLYTDIFENDGEIYQDFSSNQSSNAIALDVDSTTRWFFVDLEAAYEVSGMLWLTGGLRYDRLQVETATKRGFSLIAELNSVVPYVGLKTRVGSGGSQVTAEVKGFPVLFFPPTGLHNQTGYFGEFMFEYRNTFSPDWLLSVFFRGDLLHASFRDPNAILGIFSFDAMESAAQPLYPGESLIGQSVQGENAWSFDWQQLTVGASLTAFFQLPI
jgi:hypothetical protein